MATTERTVFEKVWDGDIPSHTLYRSDEHGLMAMLDIFPATEGHTLVVPWEAVDQWTDLPDVRLAQAAILGKYVGQHLRDKLHPLRVTKHTIGFGVSHIHDQYVPSYERGDTAYLYDPARMQAPADPDELKAMREALEFPEELAKLADAKMAEIAIRFSVPLL